MAEMCLTGVKPQVSGLEADVSPGVVAQLGPLQTGERVAMELQKVDHKLQPEEIRELVDAYQAGATIRSLGQRFVVHEQTVRAHVRRTGVVLRPLRALTSEQEVEVVRLYVDQQLTLDRVGHKLGVGASTVRKVLIRHGVKRRINRAFRGPLL